MPDTNFSFLANPQGGNGLATIGNVMNIAGAAQNMQAQRINIEASQRELTEKNNLRALMKNGGKEFLDDQGNMNWDSFQPAVMSAAPTIGPGYLSNVYKTVQESQAAKSSILNLNTKQIEAVSNFAGSLAGRPKDEVLGAIDDFAKIVPQASPAFALLKKRVERAKNDEEVTRVIRQAQLGVQNIATQAQAAESGGIGVSNAQGGFVAQTRVLPGQLGTGPKVGEAVPGTTFTAAIPPTQPTYTSQNVPQAYGVRPGEAARPGVQAQGAGQGVQIGPSPTAAANIETKAKSVRAHFADATAAAASSPLLEGIAQNIKTFAPKAITGTEQEKLAFVNGILAQLHIGEAKDLKSATDLMEKNMAQLEKNSPAATDAARVINQLASPHPTMTAEAIRDAADQIIGQVRMSRDVYKSILPKALAGDNDAYLQHLEKLNEITDARVWQFENMTKDERMKFVSQMPAEDRKAFKEKIRKAEEMGFFK